MVMPEQITALLDSLQNQPELALGHFHRTTEGRCLAKRAWAEIADVLNSVTTDCPVKSPAEWRAFYNEYKSRLFKKIKLKKMEMNTSGGGPAKLIILSPLQERLYDIIRREIGEPTVDVQQNTLTDIQNQDIEDSNMGDEYICETYPEANIANAEKESSSDASTLLRPASSQQRQTSLTFRRRQNIPNRLRQRKKHMDQAFNILKTVSQKQYEEEEDECNIFGRLVAEKLRKLADERRDLLMIKINKLIFDECYNHNTRDSSPVSSQPSTPSSQAAVKQEIIYL